MNRELEPVGKQCLEHFGNLRHRGLRRQLCPNVEVSRIYPVRSANPDGSQLIRTADETHQRNVTEIGLGVVDLSAQRRHARFTRFGGNRDRRFDGCYFEGEGLGHCDAGKCRQSGQK